MREITINVKDSAYEKIIYLLEKLKDDVEIINEKPLNFEVIKKDDSDYNFIIDARERRKKGEKLYSLDEILKEFE